MQNQGVYQKYKQVQVGTANRGKLLIMLYQGCIKFLNIAQKGIEENQLELANTNIIKAQDIINELMATLDMEQGGNIAKNLYSLYEFMNYQLLQANIKKDVEQIKVVENMILELLKTWQQIINGKQEKESEKQITVNG
ncbi:flagellar export chaperone FliS [Natronospora cellulosivora (SeqCode)]